MSIAAVFPGQGAQVVGMGSSLAERFPSCRRILDQADDIMDMALSDIIANGPMEDLTRTDMSQPAILVVSWMAYTALTETFRDLRFSAAAGLSLGEYTALLAADAIDFPDALRLVALRGRAMQEAAEAQPSGMVALIGADEAGANALCQAVAQGEVLQVANLNAPGQVVISGTQEACDRAVAAAREHGIRRAMPLPVAGAFHSPLMAPAADRLAAALAEVPFRDPQIPVYANVDAAPVTTAEAIAPSLVQQLTMPVRWADSVQAMLVGGATTYIEMGPGKTLSGMIARTVQGVTCHNIAEAEDVFTVGGSA
ncbi:MAG: [acyl-carrier-protein] S-malonyltransferase [Planctomycetota bacterium]|nr:MAG: [acyl-carrier-protein] S-malonyltransferase [Planctomycetota bacterium]